MKLLPIPLSPLGAPPPLGMWGSDLLWRYPPASPFSPLAELKSQLPPQLFSEPRAWGREEVTIFLRWCEREFDLPKFEVDLFQMNGKALCFLTKNDLAERCPGAGDILHNVLQMLIRDAQMMSRHLPSSPVTPTNRYPLSPHSHPSTPNWNALAPPDSPFYASHLHHFMSSNSITLSPAPSIDSQAGSPPQLQDAGRTVFGLNGTSSGGSNQSDSEEDTHYNENNKNLPPPLQTSPPLTPITKDLPHQMSLDSKPWHQTTSADNRDSGASSSSSSAPSTPGAFIPVKREFFPDTPEPNTSMLSITQIRSNQDLKKN
jgi:ETS translocation variant 6/7